MDFSFEVRMFVCVRKLVEGEVRRSRLTGGTWDLRDYISLAEWRTTQVTYTVSYRSRGGELDIHYSFVVATSEFLFGDGKGLRRKVARAIREIERSLEG